MEEAAASCLAAAEGNLQVAADQDNRTAACIQADHTGRWEARRARSRCWRELERRRSMAVSVGRLGGEANLAHGILDVVHLEVGIVVLQ